VIGHDAHDARTGPIDCLRGAVRSLCCWRPAAGFGPDQAAAAAGWFHRSGTCPGLGFAYLLDDGAGEQAVQSGGHRAVGEFTEA
jgi:hypothetical protein